MTGSEIVVGVATRRLLKIGIVSERMRLGFGVDVVVDEQARRLAGLGFEVVVVVKHADFVQPSRDYRLFVIDRFMNAANLVSPTTIEEIVYRCQLEDADLWILHTPPFYSWAPYLNAPAILIEYGTPPGNFFPSQIGEAIDSVARDRLNDLYLRILPCDAIASISRSIHEWLPSVVQPRSSVLYLGCDHYPKADPNAAQALRRSLGVADNECLILWVGRMQLRDDEQPYKGFQDLLELIPLVRRSVPIARFLLVGRVSEGDRYRLQQRGILVLANQSIEGMAEAYAAADMLINLSRWEGFNLALLEAQYQGTPVVAYEVGPHVEIVQDRQTGMLARDIGGFYQAVVKLARDANLRAQLGRQAAEFARSFTWDRNAQELVALIRRCVEVPASRTEMVQLRRDARERTVERPGPVAPLTARQMLQLDKVSFAHAGAVALLDETRSAAGQRWLARLLNGETRGSVLRDIVRTARASGRPIQIPGINIALATAWAIQVRQQFSDMLTGVDPASRRPWRELQDDAFVDYAFLILLGRYPESAARAGYTALLSAGAPRLPMLLQIRQSEEGRGRAMPDLELARLLSLSSKDMEQPAVQLLHAAPLEQIAAQQASIEDHLRSLSERVDRLGEKITMFDPAQTAVSPSPLVASNNLTHTVLVAFGATVDPDALASVMAAAAHTGSDILYGDSRDWSNDRPRPRDRSIGPFSHSSFLFAPDLGGAVVVHHDLLNYLGLSPHVVLTGRVLMQLVAAAHTLTHVPGILSERTGTVERPTIGDMQMYLAQIHRPSSVDGDALAGFDVRFAATVAWKAVVIVVGGKGDAVSQPAEWLLHDRLYPIMTGTSDDVGEEGSPLSVLRDGVLRLTFADGTSWGRMVNVAVNCAPKDYDLVIILEAGVSAMQPDWIERLAETGINPGVGVVAPVMLFPDGRISQAGLAFEPNGGFVYAGRFEPFAATDDRGSSSHLAALRALRQVSAVSSQAMVVKRRFFVEQGGFVETLGANAADIELCCRLALIGQAAMVDGRVTLVKADPEQQWRRTLSTQDYAYVAARHAGFLEAGEHYWTPLPNNGTTADRPVRTVRLPPVADRVL